MAHFILLNISRIDDDDNLGLVGQLKEHTQLTVRGKARKHPGGVEIVKEFAAEFQIQLIAKFPNPLFDVF